MAQEAKKARRSSGPRVTKPKMGILLYKGEIEGETKVVFDPWEMLDEKERDPTLKHKVFEVPVKRRAPTNQGVTLP